MDTLRSVFEQMRNCETKKPEKALCGVHTITGKKSGEWLNQDNYAIFEATDKGQTIQMFLVLDGHGPLGHLVSERCREQFPRLISDAEFDFHRAFVLMQDDLENSDLDTTLSGTTCVAVAIEDSQRLTIASVGDSLAVLAMRREEGTFSPSILNRAHKPDMPDELERLKKAGGLVFSHMPQMPDVEGPSRVWYQNSPGESSDNPAMTGLAMSRSLGDTSAHRVGVSHVPELDCIALEPDDDFIIMASDGVWDVLDGKAGLQTVQQYIADHSDSSGWDPKGAAIAVCEAARQRWEQISPNVVDDITCIVIKLHVRI